MSTVEILLIGIGLSMDAFAVAICKGLGMRRINYRHTFIIALFFGGFQALMPFLGWLLGSRFAQYITRYDHWIAFGLLLFIGGGMGGGGTSRWWGPSPPWAGRVPPPVGAVWAGLAVGGASAIKSSNPRPFKTTTSARPIFSICATVSV